MASKKLSDWEMFWFLWRFYFLCVYFSKNNLFPESDSCYLCFDVLCIFGRQFYDEIYSLTYTYNFEIENIMVYVVCIHNVVARIM
jgi:hypothetical protein